MNTRSERITVRVTADELDRARDVADELGVSLSDAARIGLAVLAASDPPTEDLVYTYGQEHLLPDPHPEFG